MNLDSSKLSIVTRAKTPARLTAGRGLSLSNVAAGLQPRPILLDMDGLVLSVIYFSTPENVFTPCILYSI